MVVERALNASSKAKENKTVATTTTTETILVLNRRPIEDDDREVYSKEAFSNIGRSLINTKVRYSDGYVESHITRKETFSYVEENAFICGESGQGDYPITERNPIEQDPEIPTDHRNAETKALAGEKELDEPTVDVYYPIPEHHDHEPVTDVFELKDVNRPPDVSFETCQAANDVDELYPR